jgi:hypothetical protein
MLNYVLWYVSGIVLIHALVVYWKYIDYRKWNFGILNYTPIGVFGILVFAFLGPILLIPLISTGIIHILTSNVTWWTTPIRTWFARAVPRAD